MAPDRPDHAYGVTKFKCTWQKPLQVEGLQSGEDELVGISEGVGGVMTQHLSGVQTMSNGDKAMVKVNGRAMLKDGKPSTSTGDWSYTGGTGKLAGLGGKGTFKCTFDADGAGNCDVMGNYHIAKGKAKAERAR